MSNRLHFFGTFLATSGGWVMITRVAMSKLIQTNKSMITKYIDLYWFFAGDCGEWDSSVPKIWIQTFADPVPGLWARAVHVGRVLVVRHRNDVDESAPSVGHLQDGTGFGSGRGRGPQAQGPGCQRAPGGRHVHHARHSGRPHQLDGFHDRRESGRHDQRNVAEMIEFNPLMSQMAHSDFSKILLRHEKIR